MKVIVSDGLHGKNLIETATNAELPDNVKLSVTEHRGMRKSPESVQNSYDVDDLIIDGMEDWNETVDEIIFGTANDSNLRQVALAELILDQRPPNTFNAASSDEAMGSSDFTKPPTPTSPHAELAPTASLLNLNNDYMDTIWSGEQHEIVAEPANPKQDELKGLLLQSIDTLCKSIVDIDDFSQKLAAIELKEDPTTNSPVKAIRMPDTDKFFESMLESELILYANNKLAKLRNDGSHTISSGGSDRKRIYRKDNKKWFKRERRGNSNRGSPTPNNRNRKHRETRTCFACKKQGHLARDCRNGPLWKRRAIKEGLCFNCLEKGHLSFQCSHSKRSRPKNRSGGDKKRINNTHRNGDRIENKSDKGRRTDISDQICYAFQEKGQCKLDKKCPRKHIQSQMVRKQGAPDVAYGCMREPNEREIDRNQHQMPQIQKKKVRGHKHGHSARRAAPKRGKSNEICRNHQRGRCRFGNRCWHRHLARSVTAEQQNPNGTDPKQDGDDKKEEVLVRSTMERYNVDFFKLTVDQIPKNNMASINCGHKTKHKMVGMECMLDTGSTICSVTPKHATHLTNTLGWIPTKGTKFSVENGGEKNEIFSGDYIRMPIHRPNSSGYVAIRWYISPHNEVPYPMIMGMRDMSRIGYGLHLNVGDGMVISDVSSDLLDVS